LGSHEFTGDERTSSELVGSTLLVYWYMLKKRDEAVGAREVQRAMGFSSPSSASYQLEKLRELGLIVKDRSGDYRVERFVKTGILSAFIFIGSFTFPKHVLYATFTTIMILLFVALLIPSFSPISLAALLPGILADAIFWYEALQVWRHRPSPRASVR